MPRLRIISLCVLASMLAACQGQTSTEPPIVPIRNMHEQPRFDAQERTNFYQDGRSMRPPVAHTVPREMEIDPVLDTGLGDDDRYLMTIPEPIIERAGGMEAMLERGENRFGIYCVPCHGGLGDGRGMVPHFARGAAASITPPTFHDDRLRHVPDGQIFATISNGIRNMPAYRAQIPMQDRWAIVAYVRALQLAMQDQRTAMRDTHPGSER